MAATQDDAASKPMAPEEEEEFSPPEAADQKAEETAAAAAEDDEEEDPVIRNLNRISRLNLMPPEWVENRRRRHYATKAAAAADGEWSDDEEDDDPFIQNLNVIRRRKLMPPEWIESTRKHYLEKNALVYSIYDALEKGEIESDDPDDDGSAAAEWSERLWASVDLTGINNVDGEEAIAVYPAGLGPGPKSRPGQGEDPEPPAAADDAESSLPSSGVL